MSLLPIIFRDIERPLRMLEQQMRMAEEVYPYLDRNYPGGFQIGNRHDSVTQDKEKFQVKMDVKHFTPEEITVKTTDQNALIVEAKHESQDEKGSISRHYIRQFILPEGHDIAKVETKLSGDGMLTITAPNKVQPAIQDRVLTSSFKPNTAHADDDSPELPSSDLDLESVPISGATYLYLPNEA
ncbi:hypothetical protein RN001_014771 [Aquatica leii]|uniref:SHSP domain-containing protein n=1 Tax=Aquatica leii TaxID=1421715 RepID=A0AAN7NY78_9COLE|nr:hypothetical protein RN001_014771 [Aquatica leii]